MNNKYKQSQVAGVAYLEIGALHHQKYNPPPPTCSSVTFVMIYKYISHWYPFFPGTRTSLYYDSKPTFPKSRSCFGSFYATPPPYC